MSDAVESSQREPAQLSSDELQRIVGMAPAAPTDALTLVFTDIVGGCRIKDDFGDRFSKTLEDRHRALLMAALEETDGGVAIRVEGDSYLFAFHRPPDAVRFALRAMALHRAEETIPGFSGRLDYRVGMHYGTVFVEPDLKGGRSGPGEIGDVRGQAADIAARVMGLASGGQILLSLPVFDDARQALKGEDISGVERLEWRHHGAFRIDGRGDVPLGVCEVGEAGAAPFAAPEGNAKCRPVRHDAGVRGWRPGIEAVLPGPGWVMERRLGRGGFGEVWLARNPMDPRWRSVFKFCALEADVESLRRELDIFNRMRDDAGRPPADIAEVWNASCDAPPYYIQLEYVTGGDLRQWIADHGRTAPLKIRIEMAVGMARSLDRIHRMGIVHRDVKPANFLVTPPTSPGAAPSLKLTDFGIGQAAVDRALAAAGEGDRLHGGGACFTLHDDTLSEAAGAYFFIAPELVGSAAATRVRLARNASPAADIYSLGITLYQLFAGDADRPPGIDLADLTDPVIRRDIRECLRRDPARRPAGAALAERLLAYETRRMGVRACAACGEENDEDARFCDRCGASLPPGPEDAAFRGKRCGTCDEINDLRARYCDQCGRAFPEG